MHIRTDQLEGRLTELRAEFDSGQKALFACQTREMELKEMILRISGAIQVLEEELAKAAASSTTPQPERNGDATVAVQ